MQQAAAYNRRQEPVSSVNLANGFMNIFSRLGATATVTETVRETITVGGGGDAGLALNGTGAATVTVTAAASTVTVCPGQANGAIEGNPGTEPISAAPSEGSGAGGVPPVVVPSGGVGVTVVSVPENARITSQVGNQPAASSGAAETSVSSSLAPLPSEGGSGQPEVVPPPAVSSDASTSVSLAPLPSSETPQSSSDPTAVSSDASTSASLAPLPSSETPQSTSDPTAVSSDASTSASLAPLPSSETRQSSSNPTSVPIVGAPVSDSSASASASAPPTSLAALPGSASSLTNTLVLPIASPSMDFAGAFGGIPGFIPIQSAANPPSTPTTPGVANGANAGAGPTIDLSGLTLTSQLNLGNLARQTPAPVAAA
ncbi:hypothetical protein C7999DRAFT_34280 [Corynascus novoguineensis]|uniref:Uncharacterized protein n=1 Tax=Corynascus novoguineensis TaxID=1126955 RepID=A0AAN7CPC2_9PEZI|nr:hypothetical protein C7999DRAFT_34280 [Corynascus novoguineensis]